MMATITTEQEARLVRVREFMKEPYHPITKEKYHEAVKSIGLLLQIVDRITFQVVSPIPAEPIDLKSKAEVAND